MKPFFVDFLPFSILNPHNIYVILAFIFVITVRLVDMLTLWWLAYRHILPQISLVTLKVILKFLCNVFSEIVDIFSVAFSVTSRAKTYVDHRRIDGRISLISLRRSPRSSAPPYYYSFLPSISVCPLSFLAILHVPLQPFCCHASPSLPIHSGSALPFLRFAFHVPFPHCGWWYVFSSDIVA